MSKYEIGKRVELALTVTGEYNYETHFNWTTTTMTVYKFKDADGEVFVWKTASLLGIEGTDERGDFSWDGAHKGDFVKIKATIKDHGEYKGELQTELTRCKAISIEHAPEKPTKEELQAKKRENQLASLLGEDFVWTMPYKQYKEHYADCETVAGSFEYINGKAIITVIVREGRLKASGVRGKRYSGYHFVNEIGEGLIYKAVSEENAQRRANKEFPGHDWVCDKIYRY